MTTKDCIERLTEILNIMQDMRGSALIKLYVESEDIEALQYARNKLMHEEAGEDDLK